MKDRLSHKNNLQGGMEFDKDLTAIIENDYLRATNVRGSVNEGQTFSIVSNLKGNTLTSYTLPSGYNKVIGTYEDNFANTLIYYVYNSDGEHSILRFYPETNLIVRIAQDSVFGWSAFSRITHTDLVEGKLLYWVDPKPRKVNIEKATDDKQRKYRLVLSAFDFANVLIIEIYDKDGVLLVNSSLPSTSYDDIADIINTRAVFAPYITAESCGGFVEVTFIDVNEYTMGIFTDTVGTTTFTLAIPLNFYDSYTERVIARGKYPLTCNPTITAINDTTKGYNLIQDKHFNYAVRVIYDDNEKSVYSPWTDISLSDCTNASFNGIRITFTDDTFTLLSNLQIVQRVEIVAREEFGIFKRIRTIEQWELFDESGLINTIYFDFFNDGNYEAVDENDMFRPYDAVGREISSQVFTDRLIDGNILENYDKPCPDVGLTAAFTTLSKLKQFSISGQVKIWVPDWYAAGMAGKVGFIYNVGADDDGKPTPDVWGGSNSSEVRTNAAKFGQQIGNEEGGFVIYDAMNPEHFTISKQSTSHGLPITTSGALSAGTSGERTNIINFINDGGEFFSEFTLKGLTAGSHVIRVASHWCSFGDLLDKGSFYNLNNASYHQTSMPIKTFTAPNGSFIGTGEFIYELRIDIDNNGDYEIYSDKSAVAHATGTVGAGGLYMGEILVQDNINVQDNSNVRWSVDGYLIDARGSSDSEQLAVAGVFMERQLVMKREEAITIKKKFTGAGFIFVPETTIERITFVITDHNGYFFFSLDGINDPPGGATIPTVTTAQLNVLSSNSLVIKDWGETIKRSLGLINGTILFDLFAQQMVDGDEPSINSQVSSGDLYYQILIYNKNTDVTDQNRVRITGTVESNGVGVSGLQVLYERNGRQELTTADGSFEIIAYDDYLPAGQIIRTRDSIIINNPNNCEIEFTDAINEFFSGDPTFLLQLRIASFGSSPYGDSLFNANAIDFALGTITATLIGNAASRYLKGGDSYRFALLYTNPMLQRCDLVILDKVYVPFVTENRQAIQGITNTLTSGASDGVFIFTLNFGTDPAPLWATRVHVLRTRTANYNGYLQFPVWDVKYVTDFDGTNITETTFETSTANEWWFDITSSLAAYQNRHSDSLKGYTFVEGDRIRLISDANGALFSDNGTPVIFDFKIKAERSIGSGIFLVVELSDSMPKLEAGTLVEVYSPKLDIAKELFYEIHTCIEISNGVYANTSIQLDTGDAYRKVRIVPIQSGTQVTFIEDDSISDFYPSRFDDRGRNTAANPDFKEILRTNAFRFSGKYFEDTKVNNLSTFRLEDAEQSPKRLGAINAMVVTNDDNYRQVILAIHENNTASIYLGAAIITKLPGEEIIALTSKVLGAIRILKGDFGTSNPESVASRDGKVYWWDNIRNRFIRYSLNGLTPISDYGIKSYRPNANVFEGIYDVYHDQYIVTGKKSYSVQVIGTEQTQKVIIDPYNFLVNPDNLVIGGIVYINGTEHTITSISSAFGTNIELSFSGQSQLFDLIGQTVELVTVAETIAFDEPINKWKSFYDFTPEIYGTVDDRLISFRAGGLWLHDSNNTRNNFYGTQHFSDITLVFNVNPYMIKLWLQLRIMANSKWYAPNTGDISLPANEDYPTGMISRLKKDNVTLIEGQYWVDFLRNMNDATFTDQLQALLQGEPLRGEVMTIRLQNDSTDKATLRLVEAFSYISMLTEA